MKCLVCEGCNDLIFFKEILSNRFSKQGFPVLNIMDQFFDIFRSRFHPFHTNNYECVIYGEGGKRKLFVRVLIPFIQEVFGKEDIRRHDTMHRFFVVIDADGENPTKLNDNYCQSIKDTIRSRKISRFSCRRPHNNACYDFYSPSDLRNRCLVKTSHIPISLENELLMKGIEQIRHNRSKISNELLNMQIHDALKKLAEILGLTMEQLIQRSIQEGWFDDKPWYKEICRQLESYFFRNE